MHVNMSLMRDGKNAFYDPEDALGLSATAYSFIAGVLEHACAMTAVTNPLVNSYKRLVSGYEAPVYVAWVGQQPQPADPGARLPRGGDPHWSCATPILPPIPI